MERMLTRSDVRLSWSNHVIAAPAWAFKYIPYLRCYGRIHEVWVDLDAELRRMGDEAKAKRAAHDEEIARIAADPNESEARRKEARSILSLNAMAGRAFAGFRGGASISFAAHPKQCVACDQEFFGWGSVNTCSDRCAKSRRDATRTKGAPRQRRVEHEHRTCRHCGEPFVPKRVDARFCSTRCRVASHRLLVTTPTT